MMRREDEDNNVEQAREEARPTLVRPVGSALDVFGAETPETLGERHQENEASSGGTAPVAESSTSDESRPADESADQPEPVTGTIDAAEMKAFERGRQDRGKGAQKRAIPGDLRENSRLAIAWVKGWETATY